MPETVKGTRTSGVYSVNQTTGRLEYRGQYGGSGGRALRNNIRTVGARQAARARRAGL